MTERFGPYALQALIGRGGMGEVHRALDTRKDDRVVALKRLPAGLAAEEDFQRRFLREAESAARLRDPHVIPIHDYGQIDDQPYLDMRLVDGVDLSTELRRAGPLSPARAVGVLGQVASALDAAHREGLVHRDVKPQNVLLDRPAGVTEEDRPDFVYLIDFGIAANMLTSRRSSALVSGTAAYMAPERFTAGGDHRVDVYALGCVLHELLTGQVPYDGDFMQLMWAHAHATPPRPARVRDGVPAAFDAVVATALAKDPAQRPSSAGALAAAARHALAGVATRPATTPPLAGGSGGTVPARAPRDRAVPITRQPPSPPPPPPWARPAGTASAGRPRRRSRLPVLLAVAAGSVLVAAVLVGVVGGDSSSGVAATDHPFAALSLVRHLSIAQDGRRAYLTRAENAVYALDLAAGTTSATIPVPGDITDVALGPDDRRAYVTSGFGGDPTSGRVTVLDTARNAVTATIPVASPSALAVAPDGRRVYVVDGFGADLVTVIDTGTDAVVSRIPVPEGPPALAVAPDGRPVYVNGGRGLTVLDTATDAVVGQVPLPGGGEGAPFSVAVAPDGGRVYVVGGGYDRTNLAVVDPARATVSAAVAIGGEATGMGLSPDGRRAYLTGHAASDFRSGTFTAVDTTTATVTDTARTSSQPWPSAVTVTPDGRRAYFFDGESLAVRDL